MRDLASCFGEYAVQVADTSCSSNSSSSCISPGLTIPSVQNGVVCLYRLSLPTQKHLLITLTWCRNSLSQGLTITFNDDQPSAFKLNTNSRLFRKLKGAKTIDFQGLNIEVYWDLSTARYGPGPEPVDGFYVFLTVDSELGPSIGDLAREASSRKLRPGTKRVKSSLISRQEHFSGSTIYSTNARFSDTGSCHDVLINWGEDNEGLKYPALSVCIDKKTVIRVKRLQWNFRGNQTIFLDGLLVDLMWDVHDWFYSNSGYAVFLFRTRSGMDSRLWLEEKLLKKDLDKVDFSLMIYACKSI
ncbi:hypothetical protein CASFOL_037561 [Castilleja foliolosa]|uniref:Uncharacterized protein n=1 Tax=Castilleja foliolosa TaxID=1961234 RepID=A0ABD3BMI7_9LAMI